jgi:trimethylamine--corrinoid protein Co-methyltransferase
LESTRAISLEQAVIDNDIIASALRVQRGVEVNEVTLALSLIKEMQFQANYLSSDFTLGHFRKELASLSLANRHRRSVWEKRGAKSLEEVAHEEVERILKKPKPECIDPKSLEKILSIEKKWLEKLTK